MSGIPPELDALGRAIGLLSADGTLADDFLKSPATKLRSILSAKAQRDALCDLIEAALPSTGPDRRLHPLAQHEAFAFALALDRLADGVVLGVALAVTSGASSFEVDVPLVRAGSTVEVLALDGANPPVVRLSYRAAIAVGAATAKGLDLEVAIADPPRFVVRAVSAGLDGRTSDRTLDLAALAADASGMIAWLLEIAALDPAMMALARTLGLAAGAPVPPFPLADLGAVRGWLAQAVAVGTPWLSALATALGAKLQPSNAIELASGISLVVSRTDAAIEIGVRGHAAPIDAELVVVRVLLAGGLELVPTASVLYAPAATDLPAAIGGIAAGVKLAGGAWTPVLELRRVALPGRYVELVDLTNATSAVTALQQEALDQLRTALGGAGAPPALLALLGLDGGGALDAVRFLRDPWAALCALHASAAGTRTLQAIGEALGLPAGTVTGLGIDDDPWRLAIASDAGLACELVARRSAGIFRIGVAATLDAGPLHARLDAGLLDWNTGSGALGAFPEQRLALRLRPGDVVLPGVDLGAVDMRLDAALQRDGDVSWTGSIAGVKIGDVPLPPIVWPTVPWLALGANGDVTSALGPPTAIDALLRAAIGELASWGGELGTATARLIGLGDEASLGAAPLDWCARPLAQLVRLFERLAIGTTPPLLGVVADAIAASFPLADRIDAQPIAGAGTWEVPWRIGVGRGHALAVWLGPEGPPLPALAATAGDMDAAVTAGELVLAQHPVLGRAVRDEGLAWIAGALAHVQAFVAAARDTGTAAAWANDEWPAGLAHELVVLAPLVTALPSELAAFLDGMRTWASGWAIDANGRPGPRGPAAPPAPPSRALTPGDVATAIASLRGPDRKPADRLAAGVEMSVLDVTGDAVRAQVRARIDLGSIATANAVGAPGERVAIVLRLSAFGDQLFAGPGVPVGARLSAVELGVVVAWGADGARTWSAHAHAEWASWQGPVAVRLDASQPADLARMRALVGAAFAMLGRETSDALKALVADLGALALFDGDKQLPRDAFELLLSEPRRLLSDRLVARAKAGWATAKTSEGVARWSRGALTLVADDRSIAIELLRRTSDGAPRFAMTARADAAPPQLVASALTLDAAGISFADHRLVAFAPVIGEVALYPPPDPQVALAAIAKSAGDAVFAALFARVLAPYLPDGAPLVTPASLGSPAWWEQLPDVLAAAGAALGRGGGGGIALPGGLALVGDARSSAVRLALTTPTTTGWVGLVRSETGFAPAGAFTVTLSPAVQVRFDASAGPLLELRLPSGTVQLLPKFTGWGAVLGAIGSSLLGDALAAVSNAYPQATELFDFAAKLELGHLESGRFVPDVTKLAALPARLARPDPGWVSAAFSALTSRLPTSTAFSVSGWPPAIGLSASSGGMTFAASSAGTASLGLTLGGWRPKLELAGSALTLHVLGGGALDVAILPSFRIAAGTDLAKALFGELALPLVASALQRIAPASPPLWTSGPTPKQLADALGKPTSLDQAFAKVVGALRGEIGLGSGADAWKLVLGDGAIALQGTRDLPVGDAVLRLVATSSANQPALRVGLLGAAGFAPHVQLADFGIGMTGPDKRPLVDSEYVRLGSWTARVSLDGNRFTSVGLDLGGIGVPLASVTRGSGNPVASGLLRGSDKGEAAGAPAQPGVDLGLVYTLDPPHLDAKASGSLGPMWVGVRSHFGPIYVEQLGMELSLSPPTAKVLVDGALQVAGLTVGLDDLTLNIPLRDLRDPGKWTLDLAGMVVSYAGSGISISGGLSKRGDKPEYAGLLQVRVAGFGLVAVGAWAELTDESGASYSSMFVFAGLFLVLHFPPYFELRGIGLGFGVNRGLTVPEDVAGVPKFVLVEALDKADRFTNDPLAVLEEMGQQIPPARGHHWFAAGITGIACGFIDVTAVVYVALGGGLEIGVLGVARMALPTEDFAIVSIELALKARFSSQEALLSIQAQLTDRSYLISRDCRLTGGFALCIWFERGEFVLTLGGYHPQFVRPEYYPIVPRLGFNWNLLDGFVVIKGETYFALTTSALMFGARLEARAGWDFLNVWFTAWLEALIQWDPVFFVVDVGIVVGIKVRIPIFVLFGVIWLDLELSLGAMAHIEGPPFGGWVEVDFGVGSARVPFGDSNPSQKPLPWPVFRDKYLQMTEDPSGITRVQAERGVLPPEPPSGEPAPGTPDRPWHAGAELVLVTQSRWPANWATWGGDGTIRPRDVTIVETVDAAPCGDAFSGLTVEHRVTIERRASAADPWVDAPDAVSRATATLRIASFAQGQWQYFPDGPAANPEPLPAIAGVRLSFHTDIVGERRSVDIQNLRDEGDLPLPFARAQIWASEREALRLDARAVLRDATAPTAQALAAIPLASRREWRTLPVFGVLYAQRRADHERPMRATVGFTAPEARAVRRVSDGRVPRAPLVPHRELPTRAPRSDAPRMAPPRPPEVLGARLVRVTAEVPATTVFAMRPRRTRRGHGEAAALAGGAVAAWSVPPGAHRLELRTHDASKASAGALWHAFDRAGVAIAGGVAIGRADVALPVATKRVVVVGLGTGAAAAAHANRAGWTRDATLIPLDNRCVAGLGCTIALTAPLARRAALPATLSGAALDGGDAIATTFDRCALRTLVVAFERIEGAAIAEDPVVAVEGAHVGPAGVIERDATLAFVYAIAARAAWTVTTLAPAGWRTVAHLAFAAPEHEIAATVRDGNLASLGSLPLGPGAIAARLAQEDSCR